MKRLLTRTPPPDNAEALRRTDGGAVSRHPHSVFAQGVNLRVKCNAKAKSTGKTCQRDAMDGSTKCYVHGGATPRGEASPQFKHGRYSRHLPKRIAAKMQQFADADPLDLSEEMMLAKAILADWVGRYDELNLPIDLTGLSAAGDMIDKVKGLALAIHKLKTETAITPAEVMLFLSRIIEAAKLYVPAESWVAFVARCQSVFGGDVSPMLIDGQREE